MLANDPSPFGEGFLSTDELRGLAQTALLWLVARPFQTAEFGQLSEHFGLGQADAEALANEMFEQAWTELIYDNANQITMLTVTETGLFDSKIEMANQPSPPLKLVKPTDPEPEQADDEEATEQKVVRHPKASELKILGFLVEHGGRYTATRSAMSEIGRHFGFTSMWAWEHCRNLEILGWIRQHKASLRRTDWVELTELGEQAAKLSAQPEGAHIEAPVVDPRLSPAEQALYNAIRDHGPFVQVSGFASRELRTILGISNRFLNQLSEPLIAGGMIVVIRQGRRTFEYRLPTQPSAYEELRRAHEAAKRQRQQSSRMEQLDDLVELLEQGALLGAEDVIITMLMLRWKVTRKQVLMRLTDAEREGILDRHRLTVKLLELHCQDEASKLLEARNQLMDGDPVQIGPHHQAPSVAELMERLIFSRQLNEHTSRRHVRELAERDETIENLTDEVERLTVRLTTRSTRPQAAPE